jgi:hypothetical protein
MSGWNVTYFCFAIYYSWNKWVKQWNIQNSIMYCLADIVEIHAIVNCEARQPLFSIIFKLYKWYISVYCLLKKYVYVTKVFGSVHNNNKAWSDSFVMTCM